MHAYVYMRLGAVALSLSCCYYTCLMCTCMNENERLDTCATYDSSKEAVARGIKAMKLKKEIHCMLAAARCACMLRFGLFIEYIRYIIMCFE